MNTAIIAEYNPFHNGHLLHIEKTRQMTGCENIIVLMSGDFVQRGEPAVFDKFTRTRHALLNGADMVLELPVEYATGAADVFAGKAVEILAKSGIADALCFGSEAGDIKKLDAAAGLFAHEDAELKKMLLQCMSEGMSYPAARAKAAESILKSDVSFMDLPNNILAIEYLAAIKRLGADIRPFSVKREQNGYNDRQLSGSLSSAAAIRQALTEGVLPTDAVPQNTHKAYDVCKMPTLDGYSDILAYLLRTVPKQDLAEIADVTEGLENRICEFADKKSISEMLAAVKTKRYTYTKLQRAVLHMLLGITKAEQQAGPHYIRVLGVKKDKKALINLLAQKSSLPVITRVKEHEEMLKKEISASDIYHILTDRTTGAEFKAGLVVI